MMEKEVFKAILKRNSVFIVKNEAEKLISKGYGKAGRKYLILDPLETLYLVYSGKLVVFGGDKELSFNELVERFSRENPRIFSQFLVYRDLRSRGYVVKPGYGEDIDFLVYEKGEYPNKPAKFRVIGVDEGIPIKIEKLIDILNFSLMNKKELKLAVVERRGEVVYYSVTAFSKNLVEHEELA